MSTSVEQQVPSADIPAAVDTVPAEDVEEQQQIMEEGAEKRDMTLECRDCGVSFVFSIGEQEFYEAKEFEGPPTRCKPCRAQKKASRDSSNYTSAGFGGPMNYMMMDAYGNPISMFPFHQPPSNLRTKPCHAFQRGECNYGAECRYYHDDGSQMPPGQYMPPSPMGGVPGGFFMHDAMMFMPPNTSPQANGTTRSNNHHRSGHKSRNPCFAFQRGECTYGDTCRYMHVDASSMTDANGNPVAVHHLPRGYCHAFARGECKYGDTCKFRHEFPPNYIPTNPAPPVVS